MTTERDVERVLERWLVDGVDEMPSRVFLSIVDRVERQPQQRAWRVSWRDSTMNAYLKPILAIAAVLVLAVGGDRLHRPAVRIGCRRRRTDRVAHHSPIAYACRPLPDGRLDDGDYVMRALGR